jgi:hypothetical protein
LERESETSLPKRNEGFHRFVTPESHGDDFSIGKKKIKKRIAGCNPVDAYSPMTQRLTID